MKRQNQTRIKSNAAPAPIARLSRLAYPRASGTTLLLLSLVITTIGVVAYVVHPEFSQPAPNTFHGAALLLTNWLLCG